MKLATFKIDGKKKVGLIPSAFERRIYYLSDMTGGDSDIVSLMEEGEDFLLRLEDLDRQVSENETLQKDLTDLQDATLCAPVERPGKIICLAGNYRAHIAESGYVEPEQQSRFTQQLFLKPSTSLIGDGDVINLGKQNVKVGWETELAVVIGKRGKNISEADAYDYVFGYTILNDISERGLNSRIESRHLREMDGFCDWLAGKWFDGFAPCGPWVVTKDEIDDPHNLKIQFYLNGELRQFGTTGEMIFSIPEQIAYISSIMTLEPGDIISTGTPPGAGLGDKANSLADGDELVSEIKGIGTLMNKVRWTN
ncbi:MAG: fumarylacetoacetate hydrolase family protein [Blastocatellia bacterium]|nr:fumarylacetoacetate hydrolase family protein [Blastocatellia bacterium]